jgi:hypothetical protein
MKCLTANKVNFLLLHELRTVKPQINLVPTLIIDIYLRYFGISLAIPMSRRKVFLLVKKVSPCPQGANRRERGGGGKRPLPPPTKNKMLSESW